MTNRRDIYSHVPALIEGFGHYVDVFVKDPPFRKAGQYEYHVETIALRRGHPSVASAVQDPMFLSSLYKTLQAWGIGARASNLVPFEEFSDRLRDNISLLEPLEAMRISNIEVLSGPLAADLWNAVSKLGIVENNAPIVPGTKALHHIFPDLFVPIDRAYTQKFFGWHNPEFQYGQADIFRKCFRAFLKIAQSVELSSFVNGGWCSSETKVIDNAIVGYVVEHMKGGS